MESNPLNHNPHEEAVPFPILLQKDLLNPETVWGKQSGWLFPTPQTSQETVFPFPLVFEERVIWKKEGDAILVKTIDGEIERTPLSMSRITSMWTVDWVRTTDITRRATYMGIFIWDQDREKDDYVDCDK